MKQPSICGQSVKEDNCFKQSMNGKIIQDQENIIKIVKNSQGDSQAGVKIFVLTTKKHKVSKILVLEVTQQAIK